MDFESALGYFADVIFQVHTDEVRSWTEHTLMQAIAWAAYFEKHTSPMAPAQLRDYEKPLRTVCLEKRVTLTVEDLCNARKRLLKPLFVNPYLPERLFQIVHRHFEQLDASPNPISTTCEYLSEVTRKRAVCQLLCSAAETIAMTSDVYDLQPSTLRRRAHARLLRRQFECSPHILSLERLCERATNPDFLETACHLVLLDASDPSSSASSPLLSSALTKAILQSEACVLAFDLSPTLVARLAVAFGDTWGIAYVNHLCDLAVVALDEAVVEDDRSKCYAVAERLRVLEQSPGGGEELYQQCREQLHMPRAFVAGLEVFLPLLFPRADAAPPP